MESFAWILLPIVVAGGSALITYLVMLSRMETVVAQERELLAEAQAMLKNHEKMAQDQVHAAEEAGRRAALDGFLGDIRIEERHFLKDSRSLFVSKKILVLQERLFFRNLPLSEWVTHEVVVDEGSDLRRLARSISSFGYESPSRLLAENEDSSRNDQQKYRIGPPDGCRSHAK